MLDYYATTGLNMNFGAIKLMANMARCREDGGVRVHRSDEQRMDLAITKIDGADWSKGC